MIRFQCTCGKSYELPDELAGKKVQCAGCKQVLRVPASSTSVAPSPALAASALAPPHQADPFTSAPPPSAYARQPPPRIELPTNVPAAPNAYATSLGTPQPSWQPQGNYQVGGVQIDFGNTKVKAFQRRMLWLLVISLAIVPVTVVGVVVFLQATAPRNHIPAPTKGTPFQPKSPQTKTPQPATPQPTASRPPPSKGDSKAYSSSKISSAENKPADSNPSKAVPAPSPNAKQKTAPGGRSASPRILSTPFALDERAGTAVFNPEMTLVAFYGAKGAEQRLVEVYDLRSGKVRQGRNVPWGVLGEPVDLSPDGNWILWQSSMPPEDCRYFVTDTGHEKDLVQKVFKGKVGELPFVPYGFTSLGKILGHNRQSVQAYDETTGRLLYEVQLLDPRCVDTRLMPIVPLSPSREHFAIWGDGRFVVHDANTGAKVRELESVPLKRLIYSCTSFSGDELLGIVMSADNPTLEIVRWDYNTGKVLQRFLNPTPTSFYWERKEKSDPIKWRGIPGSLDGVAYMGKDLLLLGSNHIYDLRSGVLVACLDFPVGRAISYGEETAVVINPQVSFTPPSMALLSLPKNVTTIVNTATSKPLIPRGATVSLKISVRSPYKDLDKLLESSLIAHLKVLGFQPSERGAYVLSVDANEVTAAPPTGKGRIEMAWRIATESGETIFAREKTHRLGGWAGDEGRTSLELWRHAASELVRAIPSHQTADGVTLPLLLKYDFAENRIELIDD